MARKGKKKPRSGKRKEDGRKTSTQKGGGRLERAGKKGLEEYSTV